MRKTKIIATIGPACNNRETLNDMKPFIDLARFNFSHGSREEHVHAIKLVRSVMRKKPFGVILDLPGPKIRIGKVENTCICLHEGQKVTLTTKPVLSTPEEIFVNFKKFPQLVSPGKTIYLADELIELRVESKRGKDVECVVVTGGEFGSNKGVTVPNTPIPAPALTKRDYEGLKLAIEEDNIDFVAQSFVRRADDVRKVKNILAKARREVSVIAKIEEMQGIQNVDEIIQEADAVMVARGDLGIQTDFHDVPFVQKAILHKCIKASKPAITATQMLESMIKNTTPTRAEVTDVANAILDGTDAVMLSGETAIGAHPVRAVKVMSEVAESTDSHVSIRKVEENYRPQQVISQAVYHAAKQINATVIITATTSGSTARVVASFRPHAPILAVTHNKKGVNKLSLIWGVFPYAIGEPAHTDELMEVSKKVAKKLGFVKKGDYAIITAGVPLNVTGTTNLMEIEKI